MARERTVADTDPEITAIAAVYGALKNLDAGAQERVLEYVAGKLGVSASSASSNRRTSPEPSESDQFYEKDLRLPKTNDKAAESDDLDGISPVAIKWMKRSGLSANDLSKLFNIGGDEIDLVAGSVPGAGKKERMHSVLLLKGIAAYLSTGAARVSHDQLKEACLHYDAFDSTNFSRYLKSFAAEVGGTKESGYTLSARGLTRATEIIKAIVTPKQ